MTTTDADLSIKDIYTPEQVTRLAALQGVSEFVHVLSGTVSSGVLIDLAEYVIGDDEPFDPVAEAHKARAALSAERGENYNGYDNAIADWGDGYNGYEDGPLADWERELLAGTGWDEEQISELSTEIDQFEPVVGDITVSDLAGFLTLPRSAVLEDDEGDIWRHDDDGWGWGGARYTAERIFEGLGDDYNFIVTNPGVLS